MSDYLTWLGSLDEARLTQVLGNRPEVLEGSRPADLAAVAARLGQHHSIAAALLRQPRPALQVLTALLLLGGRASVARCAGALEGAASVDLLELVEVWLRRLEDQGLAWVEPDGTAQTAPVVGAVLAVPGDWGQPARALLEAYPKDALTPTLLAWGLPRQSTKAATVGLLVEAFADPVRLARQLERLTPQHRRLMAEEVDGPERPLGIADQHRWLTEHGAAQRAAVEAGVQLSPSAYSPYAGEVPTEVRMALRGRRLSFDPVAPRLPTTEVSVERVQQESTAALEQFNEASLTVLDHCRDEPLKWLQNGGIGAREVTRVAKATRVDVGLVRMVLDSAYAAGLLDHDGSLLRCQDTAAAWRDLEAGARVTLLLEQWLVRPGSPTRTHDVAGKALPVADPNRDCLPCRDGRLEALEEWGRADGGLTDDAIAARVAWIRPLAHTTHREVVEEPDSWDYGWRTRRSTARAAPAPPLLMNDEQPRLESIADEARLLGLVAHGAATPLLRAVLTGDRAAVVSLADAMLPSAARTATFGSDLTAVVVGPPTGELSALLDSCADRESRGGAVTWRFSTASVRRALDAGVTAPDLAARLTAVATTGLPQPLAYLVGDVGRRHGALRVAPARAVIRCDDEGLLAEVAVDRKLRALSLRLVAPTVAVSAVSDAETVAALRGAGYLPMPEVLGIGGASSDTVVSAGDHADTIDGAVLDLSPRFRSRRFDADASDDELDAILAGLGQAGVLPSALAEEDPAAAAARLVGVLHSPDARDADLGLVAAIRRANRTLSLDEIQTLAAAVMCGEAVRIRYRSAGSSVTERVVSELVFSGYLLEGWCHLRNAERAFRVSEILSVAYP